MQGDFVAALMESLGSELERPAKEIIEYGLTGFLEAAVRASSAQYDDPDLIARLRIRLDQGTGSETGRAIAMRPSPTAPGPLHCSANKSAVCVPGKVACRRFLRPVLHRQRGEDTSLKA
jgi:hypothetical protein